MIYPRLQKEVDDLKKNLTQLEAYGRRENLIMENVEEQSQENCASVVQGIFKDKLGIMKEVKLQRVHRLGKKTSSKNRPIICRFHYYPDRELVWTNRRNLKGTKIVIREDLPEEMEQQGRTLIPYLRVAQEKKLKSTMKGDILLVEGKTYTTSNLKSLEVDLKPQEVCERRIQDKKMHLFFGSPTHSATCTKQILQSITKHSTVVNSITCLKRLTIPRMKNRQGKFSLQRTAAKPSAMGGR